MPGAGTTFNLRVDRFTPGSSVGALVVTPEGTELLVNPEPTDAHGRAVLRVKTSAGTPGGVYRAHVIDVNTGRKVIVPYTVISGGASAECGVLAAKAPEVPKHPKPPVVKPPQREPVSPSPRNLEPPASSGPLPAPMPGAPETGVFSTVPADHAAPPPASPALGTLITFALLAFLVERLTNGLVLLLGYSTWWSTRMEPRALATPDDQGRADRNRRVALFGLSTAVATIGAFALGVNVLRDLGIDAVRGPAALLVTGLLIGAGADPIRELITSRSRPSRDGGERAAPIQVTGTPVLQQPGATATAANGTSTVAQLHADQGPARAA